MYNKIKMKIILLGNRGQVGREIEDLAHNHQINIIGFDIHNLDITDHTLLQEIFSNEKDVSAVINAAAYTAVDKAEEEVDKAFAINCDAVKNLAIICRKYNLPLIHISTDYVYSGTKTSAYTEEDICEPINIYGKSKLAGDIAIMNEWEKHIILRTSWAFGKYGNNFVKTIWQLANEKDILNIVADQFGCPTAAADIARVLLDIVTQINNGKHFWGIYNYCGSPVINWYEFAYSIIELCKSKYNVRIKELNKITTDQYPTKVMRPKNSELQVKKIVDNFGIVRHEWFSYLKDIIK